MMKHIREILQLVRLAVQKTLMMAFLVVLYLVGFGLTTLFVRLFKPGFLLRGFKMDEACWREASGYNVDQDDSLRQS
ncbi:MAG: hypothetical protein WCI27_05740 [Candidatus Omnitrophota bacterium]